MKHYELHFFYGSFSTNLFLIIVIIGSVAFFYWALVDLVKAGWVGGWMDPGFGHNNQSEEKLFGNSVGCHCLA